MTPRRNSYPGRCHSCKVEVLPKTGYIHKSPASKWLTFCASTACLPSELSADIKEAIEAPRNLTADGRVLMPFERDSLPLLRSMPGARWTGDCWSVSLEPKDRARVLELADKLQLTVADELRTVEMGADVDAVVSAAKGAGAYEFQLAGVEFLAARQRALLGDDMGLGKAQPVTALIATPLGFMHLGDIRKGDEVLCPVTGEPATVTGVYPQGIKTAYRVSFNDHTSTECCDEHLWNVRTPADKYRGRSFQTLTLNEIVKRGLEYANGNRRWQIPVASALRLPAVKLPIEPYLLGYLLGNGAFGEGTPSVVAPDEETVTRLSELLPAGVEYRPGLDPRDGRLSYQDASPVNPNPLTVSLRSLELMGKGSHEKHVPHQYLWASIGQRMSLLRGIMDADGWHSGVTTSFSSSSEQLSDDVAFLVRSLGGVARQTVKPEPKYSYKGEKRTGRPAHIVNISIQVNPFQLTRKATLWSAYQKYKPSKAIASVEKLGDVEMVCISVDTPHKLYMTNDLIVTHNTPTTLWALDAEMGALAVVPAAVKHNWAAECRRWRPDITPVVLQGRKSFRWPAAGELVIINPDILPAFLLPKKGTYDAKLSKAHKEAAANTILIADEAHLYKSYKTARSRKMQQLSKACAKAWALTGTPMMNRPFDLYGTLGAFGLDREVFGGWKGFMRCFNGNKNKWGGYEFGGPLPEVPERMRRVMLRRTKAEVLPDLPSKRFQDLEVNGISKELAREMDAFWGDYCDSGETGLPGFEEFSAIRAELAKSRIPAMLELVETYEDSETPLVVASAHRAPVLALGDREGWEVITGTTSAKRRQEVVEAFQGGKLKGIAITIQAGGVGITLTRASTMLFVDLDWTPAMNLQAEDRICRIGATGDSVHYIRMVGQHPIDRHVHNLLAEKTAMISAAIDSEMETVNATETANLTLVEESAEAMQARLAKYEAAERKAEELAALDAAERKLQAARGRVGDWMERQCARATAPERELTPEVIEATKSAMSYMLSVCDGAVEEDGMGFNKPDAAVARWLAAMDFDSNEVLLCAERMLTRYHGQLSDDYPVLFGSE